MFPCADLIASFFDYGFTNKGKKVVGNRFSDKILGKIDKESNIRTTGRRVFSRELLKSLRVSSGMIVSSGSAGSDSITTISAVL